MAAFAFPTGERGRFAALALTAASMCVLWAGGIAPAIAWHSRLDQTLRERRELATRMASLVSALPQLKQQIAAMAPACDSGISGQSDALAAAALQDAVEALATKSGATLNSAEVVPAQSEAGCSKIGLRVSVYAKNWPAFVQLLAAIAHGQRPMLIDELDLHALPTRAASDGPPVEVQLTVYTFHARQTPVP